MARLSTLRSTLHLPLILAGVIGFALYFLLLPAVHPDASIERRLSDADLREMADEELARLGVNAADLHVQINLRRHDELLNHLQKQYGTRTLVQHLRSGEVAPLPVYYQRVRYMRAADDAPSREVVADFHYLLDGRLIQVEAAGIEDPIDDPEAMSSVGVDPDTSRSRRYVVMQRDSREDTWPLEIEGTAFEPEQLARFHIARTGWAGIPLVEDSTRVTPSGDGGVVFVRMRADTTIAGTQPLIDVEMGMGGGLHALTMSEFRLRPPEVTSGIVIGTETRDGPLGAVGAVTHVVLFILLLILFFRRLDARLIDTRGALRDSLWGGLWGLLSAGLVFGYAVLASSEMGGVPVLIALVLAVTAGAGSLVLIFVASAVGDSFAREAWPQSVRPLDLLRRLAPVNRSVGASVVHGMAVAGVILAVNAAVLWAPGLYVSLESGFPAERSFLPFLSITASAIWSALYVVFGVIAAVGGWMSRWSRPLSVIVPVALLAALDIAPLKIEPVVPAVVLGLAIGALLVWLFVRFGITAAIMALVVGPALVKLSPGWLAAPIPETVDAVIALAAFAILAVLAVVVASMKETEDERQQYVPAYVRELSEQQRIERELEIARNVQMSFLPRTMPRLEGVDAAAMCVPAYEVGGDYYDVVVLDDHRMAIMIGDVSGKGIQAAFYMTLVKGVIQSLALADTPPRHVMTRLNQIFYRNAPRGTFISIIYGVFDSRTGRFTFARAGHNPALITRSGEASFERPDGMAIGLVAGDDFDASLRERTVDLGDGDVLLLYTDGVSEAMNSAREQFGEGRLAQTLLDARDRSASQLVADLRREIDAFTVSEPQYDDMTLIVLRRVGVVEGAGADVRAVSAILPQE